jgi:sugar lactone lactonase YvrE
MAIDVLSPKLHALLAEDSGPERVASGFRFTEGPLWDPRDGSLLFSDIPANRIYRWRPGGEAEVYREPSGKSNGLTWDLEGRLLACEHARRRISRTLDGGALEALVARYRGRRLNSPNDLVLRSDGLLYFSDPPYGLSEELGAPGEPEQELNGLYLLRPDGPEPVRAAEDFDRPNGLAFNPDESRLYVADTPRYQVRIFAVRSDGTLEGGDLFLQLSADQGAGRPDGMKVDVEGNLYTTGPGGLWVVAPDGEPLAHVRLPEKAANCAWGDADYRSLYITASSSIYRLRTRVPGIAPVGIRDL